MRSLCLTLCIIWLHPTAVRSQDDAQNAEQGKRVKKAQAYLDLATSLFRDGDFEGALAELERTKPLVSQTKILPMVLFNIGRCYEELNLPIEAIDAYRQYLEVGEESERRQSRAHDSIKRLRRKFVGRLTVSCNPEGARVKLIGPSSRSLTCPADFGEVMASQYDMEISHPGYVSERMKIEVLPTKTRRDSVVLRRDVPASNSPELSGIQVMETVQPRAVDLQPWFVGAAGLSVVGGLTCHLVAANKRGDLETMAPGPPRDDLMREFELQRGLAFAGYGLAAIFGVLAFTMGDDSETQAARVMVNPSGILATFGF